MKHNRFLSLAACVLAFAAAPVLAEDQLINKPEAGWTIYGKQTNKRVKDSSTGQFDAAIEVKAQGGGNPWEAAAQSDIIAPIKKGDRLLGAIWMKSKTETAGPASLNMRLQVNSAPYDALTEQTQSVGPEWKLYSIETVADKDYAKNTTVLVVHLNSAKQTVYLGPGFVMNSGQ